MNLIVLFLVGLMSLFIGMIMMAFFIVCSEFENAMFMWFYNVLKKIILAIRRAAWSKIFLLLLPVLCYTSVTVIVFRYLQIKPEDHFEYWTCVATLAAALVALYKDDYIELINKPKLQIVFENRPPMYSFLPIGNNIGARDGLCCRLKIVNNGHGSANNVFVRIQSKDQNSNFAPMNLQWMNLDVKEKQRNNIDSSIMSVVCPKIPYYCNLGMMPYDVALNLSHPFVLSTEVKANDKCYCLRSGCNYTFELILMADKIEPVYYDLKICFNGYFINHNDMMNKGLKIEISRR